MADYRINVVIDPRNAQQGAKVVNNQLTSMQRNSDALSSSLKRMLGVIGGIALVRQGISILTTYTQTMSSVKAVSGATAAEFELLNEKAKALGNSTRFGATAAATALLELSKAGFSVKQSMEAVGGALLLSQAGGVELARGTEILVNVLAGMRLSTDQTARAVDVLTKSANISTTDVTSLGEAFKYVGPVASGVGVSLEETAAAIAALAKAGLDGSTAGTGLRRVLSELESPSKKTVDLLQSMGLTIDDVKVSQVGLTKALENLARAGIDTGTALELFGDRGGPAFEVLKSSLGTVKDFTKQLQSAGGEAAKVAAIMDDNLNGSLLKTKAAFEGLVIEIGESGATGGLRSFFDSLNKGLLYLAENADTVSRALAVLIDLLAIKFAKVAIGAAIGGLKSLGIAFAANPLTALASILTVAIALLINFGDQMKIASDSSATIKDTLVAAWEAVRAGLEGLGELFAPIAAEMNAVFGGIDISFKGLIQIVALTVDSIIGLFRGMWGAIVELFDFERLANTILAGVVAAVNGFTSLIEKALDSLLATVLGTVDTIVQAITSLVERIALVAKIAAAEARLAGTAWTSADIAGEISDLKGELATLPDSTKTFTQNVLAQFKRLQSEQLIPQLANPFKEQAADLGVAIAEAFKAGFTQTNVYDFVNGIFERAEELARQREAALKANAAAGVGAPGTGGTGTPPPPPTGQIDQHTQALTRRNKVYDDFLRNIQQEQRLLGLTASARQVANEVLALENQLREEGVQLTDAQRQAVTVELQRLQALQLQDEILQSIRGPAQDFADRQAALNQLMQSGQITVAEYNRQLAMLTQQFQQSAAAGQSLSEMFAQLGPIGTEILEPMFRHLEDAFVDFVMTGKISFSDLVNSMLRDVSRLLFQQGLKLLLGMLTGGGGSLLGGLFGGGGGGGGGGLGAILGGGGGGGGGGLGAILGGGGGGLGSTGGGGLDLGCAGGG